MSRPDFLSSAPSTPRGVVTRISQLGLASVATLWLVASVLGHLPLRDHLVMAAVATAAAVAWGLAEQDRLAAASGLLIGGAFAGGVFSLVLHGIPSPGLPAVLIGILLAAVLVSPGLAGGLAVVALAVFGIRESLPAGLLPAAVPVPEATMQLMLVGQMAFVGLLVVLLADAIREGRRAIIRHRDLRVDAERSLDGVRRVERMLRQSIEHSPTPMAVAALDGALEYVNPALVRLLAYDHATELVGRPVFDAFVDPDATRAALARVQAWAVPSGTPTRLVLRRRNGATFVADVVVTLVTDERGKPVAFAGAVNDVTEGIRVARALEERESRLQRTQRIAQIGGWEYDADTRHVTWDDGVRRIHGVPATYVPSVETAGRFLGPTAQRALAPHMARLLAEGTGFEVVVELTTMQGAKRWVSVQAERASSGRPNYVVGTMQDVTERELLTQRILEAQHVESLGRLAGGIAHDFNSLLTGMLGYLDELDEIVADPDGRDDVRHLRGAAERARALVAQLLAFARRQMVQPATFDPADGLARSAELWRRVLDERITVTVDAPRDLGLVRIDPAQFDLALLNLAVNAGDAMPDGGTIALSLGRSPAADGDAMVIRVRDTGVGMTPDVAARAFEPFFTTKGVGEGTGMGLATVHGVVHQAGGEVSIESAVGVGTTVVLRLPALDVPSAASVASAEPPAGVGAALAAR